MPRDTDDPRDHSSAGITKWQQIRRKDHLSQLWDSFNSRNEHRNEVVD
jgi:hypothetical protein